MYHTLTHHGILGQKWGKRNGPPYPLDESDHSAAEKKAAKESSGKKSNSGEKTERKGLTDGQKRALKIGAAAVGTALLAYGGYQLYKSGKLDPVLGKFSKKGETSVGDFDKFEYNKFDFEQIKFDAFNEQLLKSVQEGNKQWDAANRIDISSYSQKVQDAYHQAEAAVSNMNPTGSHVNCGPCSILMHANDRLGTDYQAKDETMSYYAGLTKFFKNYDVKNNGISVGRLAGDSQEAYDDLIDYMTRMGNGAGGICSGKWDGRSDGHFLSWKVVDNTVLFTDGQTGRVYLKDAFDEVFSKMDYQTIAMSRLDHLEIDEKALKEIAL